MSPNVSAILQESLSVNFDFLIFGIDTDTNWCRTWLCE